MARELGFNFSTVSSILEGLDKDQLTSLWLTGEGPAKLDMVNEMAEEEGYCYVRLITYCCDLARLPMQELQNLITGMKISLGKTPLVAKIVEELMFVVLARFGDVSWIMNKGAVNNLMRRFNCNCVRLLCSGDGATSHVVFTRTLPFCECNSLVCIHGWDFRMLTTALISKGSALGASGFDMNKFMSQAMGAESEPFEDVYSQLDTELNKSPGEEGQSTEPIVDVELQEMETRLHRETREKNELNKVLERLQKENERLQGAPVAPMSPPESPKTMKSKTKEEASLLPNDSSSVTGRYGKEFMDTGTVFTAEPARNSADKASGRTLMTVGNSLVSGFNQTADLANQEAKSLRKLKPINGLPRPFTSQRLNFLANLHTAIDRALSRYPGGQMAAMYQVMKSRPELPCDDLLHQLLNATISKSSGIFVSNAFRLPYIEIGMKITEEAIVATFSLLLDEYKSCWFQEFKNIRVPSFHNLYKSRQTHSRESESHRRHRKRTESGSRHRGNDKDKRSTLLSLCSK